MEKIINFFKAPDCVKQVTDKDKIDFLFFRNRVSIFLCCIALYVFVHSSDLRIFKLNFSFNIELVSGTFFYALLVGKIVNGFIADKVDSRKIGIVAFLGEAICMIILLFLIPVLNLFEGSIGNIPIQVYLLLAVLIICIAWFQSSRYAAVFKTVALWTKKTERATVFALITLASYILYNVFRSVSSFNTHVNITLILIPFILLNFAFAFLFYNEMVDSPNSIGLPDFEKYKNEGIIGSDKNIKQLSFWHGLNKHVFCNSSFWYLGIAIVLLYICQVGLDYFYHFVYAKHIQNFNSFLSGNRYLALFVFLLIAIISDKIFKGQRLPVINCIIGFLVILLLYFQISPTEYVNASLVYNVWSILVSGAVMLLVSTGSVEIGEKKYAAARFGLYSLFMQLGAILDSFIMKFFYYKYDNAVWFYIIVLVILLYVLSLLKLKHKKL